MHTRTNYFHVCRPKSVEAAELFQSLKGALLQLRISDIDPDYCKSLLELGVMERRPILLEGV